MRLAMYDVQGEITPGTRGWVMSAFMGSADETVAYAVRCGWKKVYAWQRDDNSNDAWSEDHKVLAEIEKARHK